MHAKAILRKRFSRVKDLNEAERSKALVLYGYKCGRCGKLLAAGAKCPKPKCRREARRAA